MTHPDPWVHAFLVTDPEPESLLRKLRGVDGPLPRQIEVMRLLLEVTLGLQPKEHLQKIDWDYEEPADIDLHLLFLITWFRALFFVQPDWPRMRVLRDRIMGLVSDETRPEITGWARLMDGLTQFYGGDTRSYIDCLTEITKQIPKSSPHYLRLALIRVITYLQQGMGAVAEYPEAPPAIGEIFRLRLRNVRVVNAALAGDLDSIAADDIEAEPGPPNARTLLWPSEYEVACHSVRLMSENSPNKAHRALAERIRQSLGADEPMWLTSTRRLLEGDPEAALRYARQHVSEGLSARRTVVGFDEYALIRAELACGHGEAALRLLQAREERKSWHYIDDLFAARAHLLTGQRSLATQHLARLLGEIDKYHASGRLDFELRLANELSHTDLLGLTGQIKAIESSRRSAAAQLRLSTGEVPVQRGLHRLVYSSAAISDVCERVRSFAASKLCVLVSGETGTGKELIAQALHESGPNGTAPFLAVNCAALSDSLVESELFGHAKGAFTGAQRDHAGLFRDAGRGTVLLDEIGDISPRLQTTLLRVLETREVRPVGSSKSFKIKCRILAATNANLEHLVDEGRFRRDLLFRLLRLNIHIPPLRERPDDISTLAIHFLNLGRDTAKQAHMSEALKLLLRSHSWPGNVRELRNVVERMRLLNSDKLSYDVQDLEGALVVDQHRAKAPNVSPSTADDPQPADRRPVSAPPPAEQPARAANDAERLLASSRSPLRRLARIREVFAQVNEVQAVELAELLGVSRHTAARDLRRLCDEGLIEKVCPTASPRTHYYRRRPSES